MTQYAFTFNGPNFQVDTIGNHFHGCANRNTQENFGTISGGSASEGPDRRLRVLVTFEDGRIAKFCPGRTAGLLVFEEFI